MRECKKCGNTIPYSIVIDGKPRNLKNRKYCLDCSPFGKHNTRKLDKPKNQEKYCPRCKQIKDKSLFYNRRNQDTSSYCKICMDKYSQERWLQRKKEAIEYLGGKCVCCGYDKYYGALSFHHPNPEEKEIEWTKMRLITWKNVLKELDKCVLVCSNCHAEIHGGLRKP